MMPNHHTEHRRGPPRGIFAITAMMRGSCYAKPCEPVKITVLRT